MNAPFADNLRAVTVCAALALLALASCSKTPQAADAPVSGSTPREATDLEVTSLVKTALLRDEGLKGFDITVMTTKGDVKLNGVLDTQRQIDQTVLLVRAVPGVHSIHDELVTKK